MWSPKSWRRFKARYQPQYSISADIPKIERELQKSIPLVIPNEIENLLNNLTKIFQKQAFILHCGDCAESFDTTENDLISFLQLIFNLEQILHHSTKKSIIKIGRIAGQFAKPRTSQFEIRNNKILLNYCGDIVNSIEFTEKSRKYNPYNLTQAYNKSAAITNYLRAQNILNTLYTSHEALVLNYEESLTREVQNIYYNLSAHFLWLGNKTRNINEAHIEYIRGIGNPIAIKIDSNITIDELLNIIDIVNPQNIPGKLTLISRMGMEKIQDYLPNLLYKTKKEGRFIIWSCDPMHGNTKLLSNGYKVRYIEHIKSEIKSFIRINKSESVFPGGIHLELTAEDVYECLDSNNLITSLQKNYSMRCDPRLNSAQAIDLMYFISQELNKECI